MVWCPFWFIVSCKGFLSTLNHLFDAHALSTRFGYGRPAFLARAFAAAFWVAVNGLLVLGFLVSQNAFLVAIMLPRFLCLFYISCVVLLA